jgi:hypothetical protein
MTSEMHHGRCLCGLVQYEARGAPLRVAHCHCESCRRSTGCAIATFVGYRREQVTFATHDRSTYASSPGVTRGFCARCGTPLSYESERAPGELHLYVCTFDEPQRFAPTVHVHWAERVPWLEIHGALPRHLGGGSEPITSWGP